jgi:hypothetical protein
MNYRERLVYLKTAENEFQFELDEALNGGFGGTNGGVLASLCVNVARALAPDREPVGLDARFIRSFKPGTARVTATLLNAGRPVVPSRWLTHRHLHPSIRNSLRANCSMNTAQKEKYGGSQPRRKFH